MEELLKAAILGLIEGITEFLPISSTGHLIVASDVLNFNALGGAFEIAIQLGAVLAVVWYFRAELLRQVRAVRTDPGVQRLWLAIVIAAIPAAVLGFAFRSQIKSVLFTPVVVGIALIVGGILLILWERRPVPETVQTDMQKLTLRQAFLIGVAQVAALIPGVSRSGATILGGMAVGLSREAAAAFSFLLAIPVLGGASGIEFVASLDEIKGDDLVLLLVGTIVSAISAFFAVAWLLRYISNHTFTPFGWYRIAAGALVLLWAVAMPVSAQDAQPTAAPEPGVVLEQLVEIEASDGLILRGAYFAPHANAPAVLLLHELYTTRSSWNPTIAALNEAGYNALAVDLRGWGRTRGRINWTQAQNDTLRWAQWLSEQPGVGSISMIGSSMGSALALNGCAAFDACTRAVALSPGWDYFGVDVTDAISDGFPILAVYADRDRYPAAEVPEMLEAKPDLAVLMIAGRAHGIGLFRTDATLRPAVIQWLGGGGLPAPEVAQE
jgi:undecaprenyl-diphosphatase